MIHQQIPVHEEWKQENILAFDELIISWNANRPLVGTFLFYVRVKIDEWSPWLLYASWGSQGQSSFLSTLSDIPIRVYQDCLEVLENKKATAFQTKVILEGECHLEDIYGVHVYTNSQPIKDTSYPDSYLESVYLNVPGISQITLDHIRHQSLCSPTSTTAVIRYLSDDYTINPLEFAQKSWDAGFDIFGNWVFNVAQASTHLGDQWSCWVERLNGFDTIYQSLKQQIPVIVSVRGPLTGSAMPYSEGHLLAVTGYDHLNQRVMCMDPAFPDDSQTQVSYAYSDFMQAWNRRGRVAYLFKKKINNTK